MMNELTKDDIAHPDMIRSVYEEENEKYMTVYRLSRNVTKFLSEIIIPFHMLTINLIYPWTFVSDYVWWTEEATNENFYELIENDLRKVFQFECEEGRCCEVDEIFSLSEF